MTPTYSEISLLKLVLADYLQVLELHLFAILQNVEDFNARAGVGSGEGAIFNPRDNTGCQWRWAWAPSYAFTLNS